MGAPAHNTLAVLYLNKLYGDNWFETHSSKMRWPPRSSDLSVWTFLWVSKKLCLQRKVKERAQNKNKRMLQKY